MSDAGEQCEAGMPGRPRRLKYLIIANDKYPPFRVDVAELFGRQLAGRGHIIDWVLQSEAPCARAYETTWCDCRVWVGRTDNGTTLPSRVRKHLFIIVHQMKMIRLLREGRYDFIQVKDKFVAAVIAIAAAKVFRVPFFYWLSFPYPEESLFKVRDRSARYPLLYLIRGHALGALLYKVIIPSARHVFVQSEQMKRDVVAKGIPSEKLTAVPMGVALDNLPAGLFGGTATRSRNGGDMYKLVYIGTLERVRRIDFLIRVLEKVRGEVPNVALYLVGDSHDERDRVLLEQEARRLGMTEVVEITGSLPRHEALAYVAQADVCLSPFYPVPILNSTSPTKLIEYMALGKPVVANDHPEQRLVLEQSGGGLCVRYDEDAFADAVVLLLRRPDIAAEMGACGRRYVERERDYARIADLVEGTYLGQCRMAFRRGTATINAGE